MIQRLLKIPIRFWQVCLAPVLPPCCRYYPSCSQYALEALDRHAWPKALWLIAGRLLRCNPFFRGGYDPVPGCDDHDCSAHAAPATRSGCRAHKA